MSNNLLYLTPIKGVTGWLPTSKSGLQFWFDANNAGSITKNGSDQVSQWNDLSSNARTATQTISDTLKPVYTSNSLNGKPGLSFTSSDGQYMEFGSDALFSIGNAFTLVAVCQSISPGGTYYTTLINITGSDTNRNLPVLFSNDGSYSDISFGYTGNASGGGPVQQVRVTTDFITSASALLIDYNGGTVTSTGSYSFYKANSSVTVNTSGSSQTNSNVNYIGSFGNSPPAFTFNGLIYELFAYNSDVTSDERTEIQNYLNNKWGV